MPIPVQLNTFFIAPPIAVQGDVRCLLFARGMEIRVLDTKFGHTRIPTRRIDGTANVNTKMITNIFAAVWKRRDMNVLPVVKS